MHIFHLKTLFSISFDFATNGVSFNQAALIVKINNKVKLLGNINGNISRILLIISSDCTWLCKDCMQSSGERGRDS